MIESLKENIRKYVDLSDNEVELFQSFFEKKALKKKAFLLSVGQMCRARYFIRKGCFRSYFIEKKGKEQITDFAIENWWVTDYDSLVNKIPSRIYIQAIEDAEVLALKESSWTELCKALPKVEKLFRILAEKTFIASQRKAQFMYSLSAEEMYHTFANAFPGFVQRVPQYMLASYLGFTPEFLSKIRAKKN